MQHTTLWHIKITPRLLAPLVIFALATGAAAAQSTYAVVVNAPAGIGTLPTGVVTYAFQAGGAPSATGTATVTNITYSSDYKLGTAHTFGSASQSGSSIVIQNTPSNFDNLYAVGQSPSVATTIGKSLSFDVTFTGSLLNPPTPYASTGSDFYLSLLDLNNNPIWTTDSMGRALDIAIAPDGTITPTSLYSGASVSLVVPAPEPSEWVGLSAGAAMLIGLGLVKGRRRLV